MIQLRPYQTEAVQAVTRALGNGQARQLVVMPTGTGKTVVFAHLAAHARRPVLVIAHRGELLAQAAAKAIEAGIDPKSIGKVKGDRNEWDRQFVVASVQSLHRRVQQIPPNRFGLIVIDEAHHVLATTYRKVLEHFTPTLLLGCTATPDRGDGEGLAEIFGSAPVFQYGLKAAILDGWLVRPKQWAIRSDTDLDGVHTRCGDFQTKELSRAVNSEARNRVIVESWREHAPDRPTVAFTADVQHTHDLAEMFQQHGIRAEAIHGKTDPLERAALLDDLHEHRLDVLCNCALLCEGWDAPPLSCIIMARPTQSRALYAQCIGRGLRIHPRKDNCIILDMADNSARHRLITVCDLLGLQKQDAEGGDVIEAAEQEEREARETKSLDARRLQWQAKEVDPFPIASLEGYQPTERWHNRPSSEKQVGLLRRWGLISADTALTVGEASYLIQNEIDRRNGQPATDKQKWFLRQHGHDPRGMSLPEASRMIGKVKGAASAA